MPGRRCCFSKTIIFALLLLPLFIVGYQIPAFGLLDDLGRISSPKIVQSTGEIPLINIYMSDENDTTILEKEVISDLVLLKLTIETSVGEPTPIEAKNGDPLTPVEVGVSRLDQSMKALEEAESTRQIENLAKTNSRGVTGKSISQEELELLARVIYAEARGEGIEGQVAVGAVVLNRLKDPEFPKTIKEVIYQRGAFTAVDDKQIHLLPNEVAFQAAQTALEGKDPTGGALYYYNPKTAKDRWIKTRPVVKQIGNHTFSI